MRNLPDDAIVTCDAGENRILMTHFYQTKKAGGFLQAAGSGPMGFAIPAALGAKLVHPDRPVVAVCGDGGFAMTMNGLMTAIEQDIPIITVVFNNNALGWVLHGSGPFAAEFNDFDHAAIARAMGCRGVRVEDPTRLGPALQEALGRAQSDRDRRADLAEGHRSPTSPRRWRTRRRRGGGSHHHWTAGVPPALDKKMGAATRPHLTKDGGGTAALNKRCGRDARGPD